MLGAARSSLARRALRRRKEDGDGTRSFEVVREVKSGAQRDGLRVDALAGDHGGGMGVGAQCRAQEGHCLLV